MNIYVSNISFHTTEEILSEMFGKFGIVKAVRIVKDQLTGRPLGFGFVEMQSLEEGFEAIKLLDGKEIQGRSLRVSQARNSYHDNNRNR